MKLLNIIDKSIICTLFPSETFQNFVIYEIGMMVLTSMSF